MTFNEATVAAERLKAQRDALLEAAEAALPLVETMHGWEREERMLRQAIAACKEAQQ